MSTSELENDVATFRRMLDQRKQLDVEREAVRQRILDQLGVGEHKLGQWRVKIYRSDIMQVDRERLKAALGDRFDEYLVPKKRWRVEVKTERGL